MEPTPQPRFTGTGYTLGSDTQASQPIPSAQPAAEAFMERQFTLWRNGFSLDDGQFFPFSDPSTAELLRQIRNGEIPRRLVNAGFGQEVRLLVNRRENEDYTPQTAGRGRGAGGGHFMGHGARLGRFATLRYI
jgi:UBX domain-containing protein 1